MKRSFLFITALFLFVSFGELASASKYYTVVLGSMKYKLNAERRIAYLNEQGLFPEVYRMNTNVGNMYRICIGRFSEKSEAFKSRNELRKATGVKGAWVLSLSQDVVPLNLYPRESVVNSVQGDNENSSPARIDGMSKDKQVKKLKSEKVRKEKERKKAELARRKNFEEQKRKEDLARKEAEEKRLLAEKARKKELEKQKKKEELENKKELEKEKAEEIKRKLAEEKAKAEEARKEAERIAASKERERLEKERLELKQKEDENIAAKTGDEPAPLTPSTTGTDNSKYNKATIAPPRSLESFMDFYYKFLIAASKGDPSLMNQFIDDSFGVYAFYSNGEMVNVENAGKFTSLFAKSDMQTMEKEILNDLKLLAEDFLFGDLPAFDCSTKSFDKDGYFIAKIPSNHTNFSKILQYFERKVHRKMLSKREIRNFDNLEMLIRVGVVNTSSEVVKGYYFTRFNGKWYLRLIDLADPCK